MNKVKITVVKKCYFEELVKEYGIEGFPICDVQEVGQSWITSGDKPEGLCIGAWSSMYPEVYAMVHGKVNFYDHGWLDKETDAMVACHDGLRPVIYHLECIEG